MIQLDGKKTYILSICIVLYAIACKMHFIERQQDLEVAFFALLAATLRSGIAKNGNGGVNDTKV